MPAAEIQEAVSAYSGLATTALSYTRLHGGDINEVFLVKGKGFQAVLKTNTRSFPDMFPAEASGLEALKAANAFRIPSVFEVTEKYLLLEYITPGSQQQVSPLKLGHTLAELHLNRGETFGFFRDNYIGSLPQQNNFHNSGSEFYREERLLPQLKMAEDKGFKFAQLDAFLNRLEQIIPEEPPSLIHGDLWGGNYMVSEEGEPCLIDPAVSYANREMDLAMMALFGGFPRKYTDAYHDKFPLITGWKERIPLWQLYYVLVHLNLFGAGYYSRCVQIIRQYV